MLPTVFLLGPSPFGLPRAGGGTLLLLINTNNRGGGLKQRPAMGSGLPGLGTGGVQDNQPGFGYSRDRKATGTGGANDGSRVGLADFGRCLSPVKVIII